jgi:NitT/TauT family transport system substrate-binding protein
MMMAPGLQAVSPADSLWSVAMKWTGVWLCAGLGVAAASAQAADKVRFGTNWLAEAEHGGYYQAVADGTYAKYGLDVEIVQGGPQAANGILLISGKLDFYMGSSLIEAFDAAKQNAPMIVVAAHFQKDPQMVMSHPGVGLDKFTELVHSPAYIAKGAPFYDWMVSAHGFNYDNVRPYTFNPQPFIADKHSIQQGYITSEPYAVEKMGGFKPNIFLFADLGFSTYATTVETRPELVAKKADVVQRFVDASTIGWYHYLYGDNKAANELIKKDNPEMTDDQIAFSVAKMKEYGLVDSGETLTKGVGAMDDARVKDFYDKMVKAGVEPANLDYKKVYTLQFVNKGVGLDQKPK